MTSSVGRPRPVQLLSLFMSGALYKCFLFLWAALAARYDTFFRRRLLPPVFIFGSRPCGRAPFTGFDKLFSGARRLPRADACLPDYCNIKRRKCLSKTGVCGDGDCENCVILPFICLLRAAHPAGRPPPAPPAGLYHAARPLGERSPSPAVRAPRACGRASMP